MLAITTNEKNFTVKKDDNPALDFSYNTLYARRENNVIKLCFNGTNTIFEYEHYDNGITIDGEIVTPENAAEKLKKLFLGGGSFPETQSNHNDLKGRDASDCHPMESITGMNELLANGITVLVEEI